MIRKRSPKMAKLYKDERVPLVKRLLAERTNCQRCGVARSQDIHEVKTRARGGSITDINNLRAVCRKCHNWITGNPQEAHDTGWLKWSWE